MDTAQRPMGSPWPSRNSSRWSLAVAGAVTIAVGWVRRRTSDRSVLPSGVATAMYGIRLLAQSDLIREFSNLPPVFWEWVRGRPRRARRPASVAAVRRELKAADPNVAIFSVKTMAQHMERQQVLPQLMASLIVPAGILAAITAVIGLYAVMSYAVGRRTREIGIRVAIGATPGNVLGLVLRQGLGVTAVGLGIGLAASFGLTRLVSVLLVGVSASDPLIFVGVPALLLSVAVVASYVPARRALGVNALVALKQN
jgi:hypothetical protein